ncbi:hypothetical protein ACQPZX_41395 [Actinoplanes sp. CA-142083]|uniref:hypothetical protein n=1 Tax=Actinoplanes sp. CA-142083 TaxID=3239903 RepID=UPI003D918A4F
MTVNGGDIIFASDINDVIELLPRSVVKAADEAAPTGSAAVQDDNELFMSVAASGNYLVEGWFRYTAASNTPDLRLNYSYPAGANFARSDWGAPDTSTASADTINTVVLTTADNTRGAGTVERTIYMKGYLAVGVTAGTFRVRFGQVTSSADAVTMKAGSRLTLTKY